VPQVQQVLPQQELALQEQQASQALQALQLQEQVSQV
jgi:hypothetical protein